MCMHSWVPCVKFHLHTWHHFCCVCALAPGMYKIQSSMQWGWAQIPHLYGPIASGVEFQFCLIGGLYVCPNLHRIVSTIWSEFMSLLGVTSLFDDLKGERPSVLPSHHQSYLVHSINTTLIKCIMLLGIKMFIYCFILKPFQKEKNQFGLTWFLLYQTPCNVLLQPINTIPDYLMFLLFEQIDLGFWIMFNTHFGEWSSWVLLEWGKRGFELWFKSLKHVSALLSRVNPKPSTCVWTSRTCSACIACL